MHTVDQACVSQRSDGVKLFSPSPTIFRNTAKPGFYKALAFDSF
jgi:hypothetical protein